ncbi:MAG: cytochrome c [Gammaproteobacteria bacterium]|nr:MAG: cytochrome c [Gammaproteobacteria bacterium]
MASVAPREAIISRVGAIVAIAATLFVGTGNTQQSPSKAIAAASFARGQQLYDNQCSACHQRSGSGIRGAFPPLSGASILEDKAALIKATLYGRSNTAMQGFCKLPAEDVAAILTFVRNAWVTSPREPVSPQEVSRIANDPRSPRCVTTSDILAAAKPAPPASPPDGSEPCGFKDVRSRWQLPTVSGWVLNEKASYLVNANVYLPPGRTLENSDRSLQIWADPKTDPDSGPTLGHYVNRVISYTRGLYQGTVSEARPVPSNVGTLRLYVVQPKPGISPSAFHSIVFIEDAQCFINLSSFAVTEAVHESVQVPFRAFVSGFKKK